MEMNPQEKFARALGKLLEFARGKEIAILLYSLYRTDAQQRALYETGKSKADGIIKRSKHQDGCAADLAVVKGGSPVWSRCEEYVMLGLYWKSLGGKWGGDFKFADDIFHFEM